MNYITGTYLILSKKEWICEKCKKAITYKNYYFGRCKVDKIEGKDFHTWKRFHLDCAKNLLNLNDYEKKLLFNQLNDQLTEKDLQQKVRTVLWYLEKKEKLTFLRVANGLFNFQDKLYQIGKAGYSDYIIFLPKGKTVFIELKRKTVLNKNQKQFKQLSEKLGFEYKVIKTIQEFSTLIYNIYNINNI